jgi:hypothetical protein
MIYNYDHYGNLCYTKQQNFLFEVLLFMNVRGFKWLIAVIYNYVLRLLSKVHTSNKF